MKKLWSIIVLSLMVASSALVLRSADVATGVPARGYHDAIIQVNLTLENGSAAPFHNIEVVGNNRITYWPTVFAMMTNESGIATGKIPSSMWGNCTVFAADDMVINAVSEEIFVEPDSQIYLDMKLGPGPTETNSISGVVRNSSDGSPVDGIQVGIFGLDLLRNPIDRTFTTGSDGEYSLNFPDCDSFILSVNDPDFGYYSQTFHTMEGKDDYAVDIILDPKVGAASGLSLKFVNRYNGTALNGSVDLSGSAWSVGHGYFSASDFTPNASGWFGLDVGPGEYKAQLTSDFGKNVQMQRSCHVIMNGTSEELTIPLNVPDHRTITVLVKMGTLGQSGAHVSTTIVFDQESERYFGDGITGSDGTVQFDVPLGERTLVEA
jgi:hypothetical protein